MQRGLGLKHLSLVFIINCFAAILLQSPVYSFHLSHSKQKSYTSNGRNLLLRGGRDAERSGPLSMQSELYSTDSDEEFFSKELTSNDISHIRIMTSSLNNQFVSDDVDAEFSALAGAEKLDFDKFGTIFRHSAPYIAMHRGNIMVIHLSGLTIDDTETFNDVMDDISILHLLGIKLILVIGVRERLDARIERLGQTPLYSNGMRITDEMTMQLLKEESGAARYEIESALARGFRGMTGFRRINVVSGNFFYTAKPLGVRNGVDFKNTGEVRRIEVDNFRKRLEDHDVVMITSLGYSNSGEVFNVPSESLAAECAARLKASKIIYLTGTESMIDIRSNQQVQSLRLNQAIALLDKLGLERNQYNYVESGDSRQENREIITLRSDKIKEIKQIQNVESSGDVVDSRSAQESAAAIRAVASYVRLIARCVYALTAGVRRAHLIQPRDGALLKELFTRDGSGTLIARDTYEGVRPAQESDLRSILEIIHPLEVDGILLPRSNEDLLRDIPHTFLLTRDGSTLACAMLKRYSATHAEIACLAVHPEYRRGGRGETLLAYLERRAVLMGVTHVFVLSTRTMQWFEERGFILSDPNLLPPNRTYNKERGSKVYIKKLGTQRDVDVEELMWDIS